MARVRRGRKDLNHRDVVKAFEAAGCSVADMSSAGVPGFPDVVVGVSGENLLVEIKSRDTSYGRAGLNENQRRFSDGWRGGPVHVVESAEEAVELVNKQRRS